MPVPRVPLPAVVGLFWLSVAASAVRPTNPKDYLLEVAVPVGGFALLAATYRRFPLTRLSYWLLFAEGLVLLVGAHYTHAGVPLFDWLKPVFGWQRNHYDRLAHFCVGLLLVIPTREVLRRRTPLQGGWLAGLSLACILAFAALYEISEWWIALGAAPEAAEAYLGSQGDPWDAQKDMLFDGLGAATGLLLFSRWHDRALEAHDTAGW